MPICVCIHTYQYRNVAMYDIKMYIYIYYSSTCSSDIWVNNHQMYDINIITLLSVAADLQRPLLVLHSHVSFMSAGEFNYNEAGVWIQTWLWLYCPTLVQLDKRQSSLRVLHCVFTLCLTLLSLSIVTHHCSIPQHHWHDIACTDMIPHHSHHVSKTWRWQWSYLQPVNTYSTQYVTMKTCPDLLVSCRTHCTVWTEGSCGGALICGQLLETDQRCFKNMWSGCSLC